MFKYVLYRALQTTADVFCDVETPTLGQCQQVIDEYNQRAKLVWEREDRGFSKRQSDCAIIREDLLSEFCGRPAYDDFQPVPRSAVRELDSTFCQYYTSSEMFLLFGRTDDNALEVQDNYGLSVATALGKINPRYEARAHLYLRKMYGRGAPLPLLGVASASAMWIACNSYYYRQQIATVSSSIAPFPNLADPFVSSILGLSPSQRSQPTKVMASYTPFTGSYNQKKARKETCSSGYGLLVV
jgi:hypothetical protein